MPADPEAIALAVAACEAADSKQASDLTVLDVGELVGLVEIFVLASARNDRQLSAVSETVEERLRDDHDRRPLRREGSPASGWYLLDYGDVVLHLFDEEQRDYYGLERLWHDVPRLDPVSGEVVAPSDALAR